MNKLFLFILLLGLIIFYCLIHKMEKFTWAWGYYTKPTRYPQSVELPPGSWRETCIIQDFRDPLLWASCETDTGKYIETSISADKCIDRTIRNVNGTLECN